LLVGSVSCDSRTGPGIDRCGGETITYKRVTHGSYSTATLQSTPSVQSYTIKASVRQYRAREIAGLVQQGDREVRIAAADLSFNPKPNDQLVIGGKTFQVVSVNTRSPFNSTLAIQESTLCRPGKSGQAPSGNEVKSGGEVDITT
jgi:hypothetical protein